MSKDKVNIGLIGFGTIGAGVVEIFNKNQKLISDKTGKNVVLKKVADLDITTDRGVKISEKILTEDVNEILDDPEIDIVIELIGGYEPAKTFILRALKTKKHIVSTNKALISKEWNELISTAKENGVRLNFEASVGGGIPVIQTINEQLSSNKFSSIYGVLNGTANYILSEISENGTDFKSVLKEAQKKGYAELDPTFDIEGNDTAHKIIILSKIAFGKYVSSDDFLIEGISNIDPMDIEFANSDLGCSVKLLGIAKDLNGRLELRVHPTFVPKNHILCSANGVFNGIYLEGDFIGPIFLYGQGAGRMATASAVVGDCVDIILNPSKPINYGPETSQVNELVEANEIFSKYYVRLMIKPKDGVIKEIFKILNKYNIDIDTSIQNSCSEDLVPVFLITNMVKEIDVNNALLDIKGLDSVKEEPVLFRILN
ncbi:MAG: homoserine dehydrogenase [Methanobrevibacter sp.]|jgi:homoserine dehydrogenase|nr:homoserine dehydrogenase [Candidatus Methanovirga australis]